MLAKLFTAIIAENITRLVEKEQPLPENHYGGRPGRMTTDMVHVLVDKIKSTWRKGRMVSVLFLDVEGAFPNAVTDRLLHNLRKCRIPEVYTKVIWLILEGRRTRLRFDDFISDPIWIDNGIGQGDPLSMVLYILYNADLLDIALNPEEESLGFVDNAMIMAEGKNTKETLNIITDFMERDDSSFSWSTAHNSKFEIDKLALVHFSKRNTNELNPGPAAPALRLKERLIKTVSSYKYLGIHLDSKLNWSIQMQKAISKATAWILLFQRLTRPSLGMSPKHM